MVEDGLAGDQLDAQSSGVEGKLAVELAEVDPGQAGAVDVDRGSDGGIADRTGDGRGGSYRPAGWLVLPQRIQDRLDRELAHREPPRHRGLRRQPAHGALQIAGSGGQRDLAGDHGVRAHAPGQGGVDPVRLQLAVDGPGVLRLAPARTFVPACCRGDFSMTSRTRTPSPVQAGSGKKPSAAVESASGRVGR